MAAKEERRQNCQLSDPWVQLSSLTDLPPPGLRKVSLAWIYDSICTSRNASSSAVSP